MQYDYTRLFVSVHTMAKFVIEGGQPLNGEIEPIGNKNAVLKMMAAALLTTETVIINNVPAISDVLVMAEILQDLGATVIHDKKNKILEINAASVKKTVIKSELAKKLRASNTLLGPLLARFGTVTSTLPGGDKIGPREMNAHFDGLSQLGAHISFLSDDIFCLKGRLRGQSVFLYEPSVTATENVMLAAVLTSGTTTVDNAAAEPHVRALAEMVKSMGGKSQGAGTNRLIMEGVKKIAGTTVTTPPDFIYIGTMIVLAIITGGELKIRNVSAADIKPFEYFFGKLGARWHFQENVLIVPSRQTKKITDPVWARTKGIYSQPWPCFPSDMMSLMIVLATQVKGSMLFFEKMYPGRMFFADYLNGLGANIVIADPHRVIVNGSSILRGGKLFAPDLRAGMAHVAAGLIAHGNTTVEAVEHIDRGYPMIETTLQSLGAKIIRSQS